MLAVIVLALTPFDTTLVDVITLLTVELPTVILVVVNITFAPAANAVELATVVPTAKPIGVIFAVAVLFAILINELLAKVLTVVLPTCNHAVPVPPPIVVLPAMFAVPAPPTANTASGVNVRIPTLDRKSTRLNSSH